MALADLDPASLAKTLGFMAAAQNLIVDVLRGKSVTKDEVTAMRQAFIFVRKTLDALDDQSTWSAVPNVRVIVAAGDALATTPGADVAVITAWRAATDPWRG
jgi:hypothetical protein